jgi:hypothetical protein
VTTGQSGHVPPLCHPLAVPAAVLVATCCQPDWSVTPQSYLMSTITITWGTEIATCMDTVMVSVSGSMGDLVTFPLQAAVGQGTIAVEDRCKPYTVRLGGVDSSTGMVGCLVAPS